MSNKKVKITVKGNVSNKDKKPIKPKLGRGIGGFLTTSLKLKVEKDKANKENKNKKKNG